MFKSVDEVKEFLADIIEIQGDDIKVLDQAGFRDAMDRLALNSVLNEDEAVKEAVRWIIREGGQSMGIMLASIHDLYMARGRGEYENMTVPAINVRGLTYDFARAVLTACLKNNNLAVLFEIARSEQGYTFQPPAEFMPGIMAAAIKEGYPGPLFIQGDHYQVKAAKFRENADAAVNDIRDLIKSSIEHGFYNIDLDTSTLVDLDRPTISDQQKDNFEVAAELTKYIRSLEPEGVTVSTGGEIGEVGLENTTVEELEAYMEGYKECLGPDLVGLSKLSVQTGTTHGGIPLPDGSIAEVSIDFETLEKLSAIAIEKYGLSGCVQHGASTLPDDAFNHFPRTKTSEIHLATGFQNLLMESPDFPQSIKDAMYKWIDENLQNERKEGMTDEQFYYKTRKKAWGPVKPLIGDLPEDVRAKLRQQLEDKFDFLYKQLNAVDTADLVKSKVSAVRVKAPRPAGL